jgi:hypothetical protein
MFSTLRTRFGIPGVISVMALVFAMFGGAYAATNGSSGGKATASAKAKKGPRGPKGATGPQGPAGPQGPKGDTGAPGTPGKDGTSVANSTEPAGPNCKAGGTKLVGTSTTYACNGEKGATGATGKKGDPWTVGGTLPEEATETGAWAFGTGAAVPEGEVLRVSISFPIPLAAELTEAEAVTCVPNCAAESHIHFINQEGKEVTAASPIEEGLVENPPHCDGTAAAPSADPGHLCVYTGSLVGATIGTPPTNIFPIRLVGAGNFFEAGASTAGATLIFSQVSETATGVGTFAVTG